MKVLHVFTVGYSALTLSRGWFEFLDSKGVESHLLMSTHYGGEEALLTLDGLASVRPVEMTRGLSPLTDLRGVGQIRRVVVALRPDLVHLNSPKASFLASLALRTVSDAPPSLYMVRGYPAGLLSGLQKRVTLAAERLTTRWATETLFVSGSLREAMRRDGIEVDGRILGEGSSGGVDTQRFRPPSRSEVAAIRKKLGIGDRTLVAGIVGRVTADKGINDLQHAWTRASRPGWKLLIVGSPDEDFPPPPAFMDWASSRDDVLLIGQVPDTREYYWAMDVLLHPSHREGFPNAVLEAAASGIPTLGANAVGTVDAIEGGGRTGWFHRVGDAESLASSLSMLDGRAMRAAGQRARSRVLRDFDVHVHRERLWQVYLRCVERRP